MSTAQSSISIPSLARPLTVEQYERLVSSGALTESDDVELLEGWICTKMSRNPPHDQAMHDAIHVLSSRIPRKWTIRVQSAIRTPDSMPEPDLAIVLGPRRRYKDHHPEVTEVVLVIEVANETLAEDRAVKGRLYARAGIATYWIINVKEQQIEVYTDPTGPDPRPEYRTRRDYRRRESVPFVIARGKTTGVPVREIV